MTDLPRYIILEDATRSFILRKGTSSAVSSDTADILYHVYLACNSAADAEQTIKALRGYDDWHD